MDIKNSLHDALHFFENGDTDSCATICREILKGDARQPQALFLLGLTYHQQGDSATAADHLALALEGAPDDPRILYNHGVILLELERPQEACTILSQLTERYPEVPEANFLLGNALAHTGQPEAAIVRFQRATDLRPDYLDAWLNLGITLKEQARYADAVTAFQRVLDIHPAYAPALLQLGLVRHAQGSIESAIDAHQKLLSTTPDDPQACYNMGVLLRDSGRAEEAIPWLEQAVDLQSNDPSILTGLGQALHQVGRFAEASTAFRRAIALNPEFPEAYSDLGNTLYETGCFKEAISAYEHATALNPELHQAWYNLGKCHLELLETDTAIAMYRKAIAIRPDLAEAHWNLSHVLLLIDQYEEGFREYLWRWKRKAAPEIDIPKPEWQGEAAPEQTLLVHAEQGLGDTIQFIRYLPLAHQLVGKIYLTCDQSLIPLFQSIAGVDAILGMENMAALSSAIDMHVPLLNLPTIFRTTETTIPSGVPYLRPDAKRIAEFAPIFAEAADTLKIGIAWQGNPHHTNDASRSCHLTDFQPLFDLPGATFYCLQKTHAETLPSGVMDLAPQLHSFADTAAIMAHLDLVISVDTSVVHLAGALAKQVWTLLPYVPDWRWRLAHETTDWYPTMRLFRQPQPGEWQSLITSVRSALHEQLS